MLHHPIEIIKPWVSAMTNPGDFREAILALVALGGGAFSIEQYIRFRPWPRSNPENGAGGEPNG